MDELKGIEHLKGLLARKAQRVETRYKYYDMKNSLKYFHGLIPASMRWMTSSLGWCGKTVDTLADRLSFRTFDNDNFNLNAIFDMNNKDILFDSAILSALIASCSFIYISRQEDGFPKLEVIDGANATGIIDSTTNLLKEGYAVLDRGENNIPTLEAYFVPGKTTYYVNGNEAFSEEYNCDYPLLVPIIFRPEAKRPFGHSRITRALMDYCESARRTLLRSEVASEFYSHPQKYALGMSQEAEDWDKWQMTISAFLRFDKDEDGDRPTVGQFSQQSMSPFIEQMKMYASLAVGETGLTMDDLGFNTVNPSSAEAIKASHETLRLVARKAQKTFGVGFLNAGFLAACVRDNVAYNRSVFYMTKCRWYPIFEPDTSAVSLIGDAVIKMSQSLGDIVDAKLVEDMTGWDLGATSPTTLEQIEAEEVTTEESEVNG